MRKNLAFFFSKTRDLLPSIPHRHDMRKVGFRIPSLSANGENNSINLEVLINQKRLYWHVNQPTSTRFVAKVWKAPDISKTNAVTNTREQKFNRGWPLDSFLTSRTGSTAWHSFLRLLLHWFVIVTFRLAFGRWEESLFDWAEFIGKSHSGASEFVRYVNYSLNTVQVVVVGVAGVIEDSACHHVQTPAICKHVVVTWIF